ncbi:hypothetical protein L218DRAFT_473067 [Marasmius fiardii PR-910]|nr:hypothetical protein L218DRAFT_473067 [Marasmius fiardii PR-910]
MFCRGREKTAVAALSWLWISFSTLPSGSLIYTSRSQWVLGLKTRQSLVRQPTRSLSKLETIFTESSEILLERQRESN